MSWCAREPPLAACGLAAPESSFAHLRAAMARRPAGRLRGLRFAGGVVLLGQAEDLPGVRDGTYLDLVVNVSKNWQTETALLDRLGY